MHESTPPLPHAFHAMAFNLNTGKFTFITIIIIIIITIITIIIIIITICFFV
jgi:hypothetical protein